MGRVNKMTEGVFTDLVGTSTQISKYDEFINNIGNKPSKDLKSLKTAYVNSINTNKDTFIKLAALEEVILQIRSRDEIMTGSTDEVKLSLVREYLYARYPFYRKGMTTKDIRVIVDKSEFWGQDLNVLIKNKDFMSKAKEKLVSAMNEIIDSNLHEYKKMI
jgi:hypothetical protein